MEIVTSIEFLFLATVAVGAGSRLNTSEFAAKAGAAAAVEITGTDHAAVRTSVRRLGPRVPVVSDADAVASSYTVLPQMSGVLNRACSECEAYMSP